MAAIASRHHVVRAERDDAEPVPTERSLKLVADQVKATEALRATARLAWAAAREEETSLGWLWDELAAERSRAVDAFCRDGQCFVLLRDARALRREYGPMSARSIDLFRRVLLGEPQKVIAIELGVSSSLVAATAAHCARAMGFACCATRIPLLMLMATRARTQPERRVLARRANFTHEEVSYAMVSAGQPELARWSHLTRAEREVLSLLVERRTNAEIARLRKTSARTVANQITSVQRKLGARGRAEILSLLIQHAQPLPSTEQLTDPLTDPPR